MKRFDTVYTTGCSHIEGSGFQLRNRVEWYSKNRGVIWKSTHEMTYPNYIAKHFECDLINEGKGATGVARAVRKTYEYINRVGIEKSKKTLFVLQFNNPLLRVEKYVKAIDCYGNFFHNYDENGKYIKSWLSERNDFWEDHSPDFFEKIEDEFTEYMEKHHDSLSYEKACKESLIGLLSYMNFMKLEFFFNIDHRPLLEGYEDFYSKISDRLLKIEDCYSVYEYALKTKSTIEDETNGECNDGHPGYECNKTFGEIASLYIQEYIERKQ